MSNLKASECLNNAIDAIQCFGWIQFTSGHRDIGFCVVGALDYGAGFDNDSVEGFGYTAYGAASSLVRLVAGLRTQMELVHWNDLDSRTKEEVLEVLREAKVRALVQEVIPA